MRIYELSDGMMIDLEAVQVIEPLNETGQIPIKHYGVILSCGKRLVVYEESTPRGHLVTSWVNYKNRQESIVLRTGLQRFLDLYKSFGFFLVIVPQDDGTQQVEMRHENFGGYNGFYSTVTFDAKGKFVKQEFWE